MTAPRRRYVFSTRFALRAGRKFIAIRTPELAIRIPSRSICLSRSAHGWLFGWRVVVRR